MLNYAPRSEQRGVCLIHSLYRRSFRSWQVIWFDQGQSRGKEEFPMRDYELTLIIHPDLEEGALNEIVEKVKGWVVEANGSVVKVDFWGKRKLSHIIKKQRDGQYVLFKLQTPTNFVAVLERNLRLTEPVMRFLIAQV
jgi:small subunit ribosomal protein S6